MALVWTLALGCLSRTLSCPSPLLSRQVFHLILELYSAWGISYRWFITYATILP